MEVSDYDFYYQPYHRVPMNSATTQTGRTEFQSIGTYSTNSAWSRSKKRTIATKYIDATTMFGQYDCSYNMKDLFPKGKGRQKPLHSSEKKDAHNAYMSLLPTDVSTARSGKTRSPVSVATPTQPSSDLSEKSSKSVNTRNKRLLNATISDYNSESKFYTRSLSTHANGAWVRRYKTITESQILSNFFRDEADQDKIVLKKRPYQQIVLSPSITPLTKRRREKC